MLVAELAQELKTAQFGDARLSSRLGQLVIAIGNQPTASFTAAMPTKAEIEGCYRFFDNPKVTPQRILRPHIEATRSRVAQKQFVVIAQDTTEIDLTRPNQQVRGAGPLSSEKRRGVYLHPSVAFDRSGVPLGIVDAHLWTRDKLSTEDRATRDKKCSEKPIEQKESYRWLQGFRKADEVARQCPPTMVVSVSDSESDIYELFSLVDGERAENHHVIIRGSGNRSTTEGCGWLDVARNSEPIATYTVGVRQRKSKTNCETHPRKVSREARTAEIEVRTSPMTLKRPHSASRTTPKTITVNVVLCEEPNPPAGEVAISWILVTTLPITTAQECQLIIDTYCLRWQIEITQAGCVSRTSLYQLAA